MAIELEQQCSALDVSGESSTTSTHTGRLCSATTMLGSHPGSNLTRWYSYVGQYDDRPFPKTCLSVVTYNRPRAFSFTGQVPWRACGAFLDEASVPKIRR